MYINLKPQPIIAPYQIYLKERTPPRSSSSSNKGYPKRRIVRTPGCTTADSFLRYLLRIANTANAPKIRRLAPLIDLYVLKRPRSVLASPITTKPPSSTSPTTTAKSRIAFPTTAEKPPIPSFGTIPAELRKIIFSYCCSHHAVRNLRLAERREEAAEEAKPRYTEFLLISDQLQPI